MNELIQTILNNFTVGGKVIPVMFLRYEGHEDTYITYMEQDEANSYAGDDSLLGYVTYYDFDVYSKGNYLQIVRSLKALLEANGFRYQPSRSSMDFYETETGYYHKTLNFAYLKQEDL